MASGSERGAWLLAGREGFLEEEGWSGAGKVSALGEDQDTGRGLLGGKAEALEEAGDAEETRRQRQLEGAGGMVGGSVILCPLLFSLPASVVLCQRLPICL